ncbi:hypothetical protein B0H10DRAFT_1969834 [Mycena sp. CBHHK59/15]|nr:hypothetical protein B0H10DRAFT_1969834 [Mycena sp. CBHHK59/15]
MEMPGLKTRDKNKITHPAVAAGVGKGTRRTATQMQQAREAEKKKVDKAALQQQKALAPSAEKAQRSCLEDADTSAMQDETNADAVRTGATAGADSGSEDVDQYAPDDEESSESEDESEDESEEDKPPKKKQKSTKSTATRADVSASRKTQARTGTPAVAEDDPKKRKRKDKFEGQRQAQKRKTTKKARQTSKKSGLDTLKPAKSGKGKNQASTALGDEDNSMVAAGGPALDDDANEDVEKPKKGKKKRGLPADPVITIQPVAKPPTQKQQRGGATKWGLVHLPPSTQLQFTDQVVPLVRELVGTLPPWASPTIKQTQDIIDKVYGAGKHVVTAGDPWIGLIGYRLSDWRSGIATQACKGLAALIENYEPEDDDVPGAEEAIAPAAGDAAQPSADGAAAPAADAAGTPAGAVVAPPPKLDLSNPDGIQNFIMWVLQTHAASGTMAFHWKVWGNGDDKESQLIMYTFAYHLAALAAIPAEKRLKAAPVGALLLSAQAVHRALLFWRTGEYVYVQKPSNYFSIDNWGDHTVANADGTKGKVVRRATKYLASVQKWNDDRWKAVKAAAQEWVEVPSRKRAASSRSASEAGNDVILSEEEEVIVLSD